MMELGGDELELSSTNGEPFLQKECPVLMTPNLIACIRHTCMVCSADLRNQVLVLQQYPQQHTMTIFGINIL